MWVDVENGRLYVEVTGTGAPLILVHGWPLDHRMFAPQVSELSEHFTVITFDRRGFGRSDAEPDLRLELDDIDRILDALDLQTVHLLGMSQGGRIALRYAATRPHRLRSLLLQGAVIDGFKASAPGDEPVPIAAYAALAKEGQLPEVIDRWLQHPLMWLGEGHDRELQWLRDILADYKGTDLIEFHPERYAFDADVLAAMDGFPRPTLLLTGAAETAARREHASELLRRIPECREVVFDHSGHLSNLSEPERYNQTVVDFCTSVDQGPALSASGTLD